MKRTDRFSTSGPFAFLPIAFLIGTLLLAACSVVDGSGENRPATPVATTSAASSASDAAAEAGQAVGLLTLNAESYALDFDCYAAGAGEIVAIGTTTDTVTETRIEVYLQAFLGEPYLGISVIDETIQLYEPAVDRPLEITITDNIVRVADAALVTELDLATGKGTDAGVGSVVVECRSYSFDLPPGFVDG